MFCRMYCRSSYIIYYNAVIFFLVFVMSKASVKWEIQTKPLVIGEEARLSCNGNNCPPHNIKKWLGGKNYDLLCFDNQSKKPFKYEMTSNGTTFDLMIKNFNLIDLNCEYTCACGFEQYTNTLKINDEDLIYPPSLRKNVSTKIGGIIYVDALLEVFPSPNCKLLLMGNEISSNITVRTLSDGGDYKLFGVAINQAIEIGDGICSGNITLNCELGSKEYSFSLHRLDLCKDEYKQQNALYTIIGFSVGAVYFLTFASITFFIYRRRGKFKKNREISKSPDHGNACMVQLIKSEDHTGTTDEGTPCNK